MTERTTQHELKVVAPYFDRLLDGTKTFEVRKDDRGFKVGDSLWLREWCPNRGFSGRCLRKRVGFMFRWDDDDLGTLMLNDGTVVMGLTPLHTDVEVRGAW